MYNGCVYVWERERVCVCVCVCVCSSNFSSICIKFVAWKIEQELKEMPLTPGYLSFSHPRVPELRFVVVRGVGAYVCQQESELLPRAHQPTQLDIFVAVRAPVRGGVCGGVRWKAW